MASPTCQDEMCDHVGFLHEGNQSLSGVAGLNPLVDGPLTTMETSNSPLRSLSPSPALDFTGDVTMLASNRAGLPNMGVRGNVFKSVKRSSVFQHLGQCC